MNTLKSVSKQYSREAFSEVDIHFAKHICALADQVDPGLESLLRVLSFASRSGNVAIELDEGITIVENNVEVESFGFAALQRALTTSGICGNGNSVTPIVLDSNGFLYLYRLWRAQEHLVSEIVRRSTPPAHINDNVVGAAIEICEASSFTIITGGPGTGKTTLVSRLLANLISKSDSELDIVVCAPTGKAAARLKDSIRQAKQGSVLSADFSCEIVNRIPDEVVTIHKLLSPLGRTRRFRFHKDNPLAVDVLVVDESSMVDILLMSSLFSALPDATKVILVGDENQLSSIEAGKILSDLCAANMSTVPIQNANVSQCVVRLKHSYRFASEGGIGRLAAFVNEGESEQAITALRSQALPGVKFVDIGQPSAVDTLYDIAEALYQLYWQAESSVEKLREFERSRVLCAVNHGPFGVEKLNEVLSVRLRQGECDLSAAERFYENRSILITENNYNALLYNGDTGLVCRNEQGSYEVVFPTENSSLRKVPVSMLGEYQDALAMTIHKSQGSEFDNTIVVIPPQMSPVLSRELLYTAVTRAREQLIILGTTDSIRYCIEHPSRRTSSFRARLWNEHHQPEK